MTTVQILLSLHVLAALVAVGATVSYFFWLRRAVLVPESRSFTLETVRLLERRMVIPAYVLVLLTGLGLVDRAGWAWSTPWIELALMFLVVLMGLSGLYARTIKGQVALISDGSGDSAEYERLHARARILLALKVVLIIVMVYLMVFKPALWG